MKRILETLTAEGNLGNMLRKSVAFLFVILISLIFFNVFLNDKDGRNSVVSLENSNTYVNENKTSQELRLENILECMAGTGNVEVMIKGIEDNSNSIFNDESSDSISDVKGVIVVAEGASNAVIKSEIVDAVATVCSISPNDVIVFEMGKSRTGDSDS